MKKKNNKKGFNNVKKNMNNKNPKVAKKNNFKKIEGTSLEEMCNHIISEENLTTEDKRESTYPDIKVNYQEAIKKEVWLPMYSFEKTHEISSMGRVRSKSRYDIDKNGKNYFVRGTIYKIKNESMTHLFSLKNEIHEINLVNTLGKTFYEKNEEYSLINPYSYFVKENSEELFISLSNICSNGNKKITIYNKFTNEETLINGGGLIMLVKYLNDNFGDNKPKELGRFTQEDLLSARRFEVDKDLGLIISDINYVPNIQIIIRRGSAYKILLERKKSFDVISSGHILDKNQIGLIWTGKEIYDGLLGVINNNPNLHRFALGMINRYFKQTKFPLNFNDNYVITYKEREDGKALYQIMSYFKLARYEELTITCLPKETMDRLIKDRKITKKYKPEELLQVAKLKLSLKRKQKSLLKNKKEKNSTKENK